MVFPSTHWSMIRAVRDPDSPEVRQALARLIERYYYPVYVHIRSQGVPPEDAEDLVQDFFTKWLNRHLFGQADKTRGRFRNYLLTSLNNFIKNAKRNKYAQRRWPAGGFREDEIEDIAGMDTPATEFHRAFASEMTRSVLGLLEEECERTGKHSHYSIFQRRIVEPALDGAERPSMKSLADQFQMTEKQAANCLVTMKRAYRRLMESQIYEYAASPDDVQLELHELMGHLHIDS